MAINLPITGSGLGANTLVNKSSALAAECAAEETKRKIYTSTWDGLRKITKNEGPLTLWRGLTPTLAMAIPANVIYFAGYDWLRYNRESPFRRFNVSQHYIPLLAGSSARVLAAISINPIELFRTRMQASTLHTGKRGGNMVETFNGLKEMVAARGYKSLWTGLSLTLWRDVPFSAIYWWGYEQLRETIRASRILESPAARSTTSLASSFPSPAPNQESAISKLRKETHFQTFAGSAMAGAGAGAFAALVTTPFDVGKTRQQVIRYQKRSAGSAAAVSSLVNAVASSKGRVLPEELNMPRFLMHIFRTEGTSGLFRGWAARCLKVAPACAIMITVYEIGKKVSAERNHPSERER
jgi:solute carrier family 25, member 39/40